jgi:glutamate racemase
MGKNDAANRNEYTAPMSQTTPETKFPTIGVFDSGFGGLTVLRALLPLISGAHYIYLGDTARLPYGSKSRETIARYAVSSAKFLHEQGAELLVIACNTATALALEDIQRALPIPVIGVVAPGAHAALNAAQTCGVEEPASQPTSFNPSQTSSFRPDPERVEGGVEKPASLPQMTEPQQDPSQPHHVLVLATAATVQSHAYTHALNALGLEATEKACPLLVPLVEEGWINHPVTDEVLKIYLTEALTAAPTTQTLLLGCTHYPLIGPAIRRTLASLGRSVTIIDSADATAQAVAAHLELTTQRSNSKPRAPRCTFYATDSIEKFWRLGSSFLGQPLAEVNLVDLGG